MKTIKFSSKGFAYEGYPSDAHEHVINIRRAFETAGLEMGNELNDFIFHIEVVLQEIGYLTEDFEIDESYASEIS